MSVQAYTVAFQGMEAREVEVQCHLAAGLPSFSLVGLPDKAVAESKERVRAALNAIGLALPPRRITINLAPADLPKEGAHFDLPIALALLAALDVAPAEEIARYSAMGELSLDGRLGFVTGALPAALSAAEADRGFICPSACGSEAALVGAVQVLSADSLLSLINHFNGKSQLAAPKPAEPDNAGEIKDLADVKGQETARRALEVAAAGAHNLLMIGPPGAGKSMLAECLPGVLPPMDPVEALEVSMIHSVAGLIREGRIPRQRPYMNPHHGASMAAMVGGGRRAAPGQISLAHNGVLFLDELPEFARPVLDSLRQPLETGETFVARANAHVRYPARFQLIAAMNPCRCGGGQGDTTCRKGPRCAEQYQARLSGPFLDRIDLFFDTPPVTAIDLTLPQSSEGSADVAKRVAAAREAQAERYDTCNSQDHARPLNVDADGKTLDHCAAPDAAGQALIAEAAVKLSLSARAYHRVMRVARTIADLEGDETVGRNAIAEAVGLRTGMRPV